MPKSCCVPGCTANKTKKPERQFYIIPGDRNRRNKWLSAINRATLNPDGTVNKGKMWSPPSNHCYVCSVHFISGAKVNDCTHPDYVPSIFPVVTCTKEKTAAKSTCKMGRYNRFTQRAASAGKGDRNARKRLILGNLPTTYSEILEPRTPLRDLDSLNLETPILPNDPVTPLVPMEAESSSKPTPIQKEVEPSEREMMYEEMNNLRKERDEAREKAECMEHLLHTSSLSSTSVEGNDAKCKMLCGVSWAVFMQLFLFLSPFIGSKGVTKDSIPLKEQLFVTLVKLRHNCSFDFISSVKGLPKTTTIDHFWKWIDLMNAKIGFMVKWQDRENIFRTIPPVFRDKFPRLTSIIDCFEIFIDAPKNLLARAQCYSNYKKHTTIKVFVSCTSLGAVNFLSHAWGGRASDIQIVRESGFIDPKFHQPGDQILADRGFTLKDDFATACSAELLIPAFTKGKRQLPAEEVEVSRKISSVRIHIERVIGLMKNRFTILQGCMPIRCVQSLKDETLERTLASCDKILTVCASLTNMGESIVYRDG